MQKYFTQISKRIKNVKTPWGWIKAKIENHWEPGRQGTGYERFALLPISVQKFFKFDMLFIRMKEGVKVPPHFDFVPVQHQAVGYWVHRRFNIILKQPKKGGRFYIMVNRNWNKPDEEPEWEQWFPNKRINYFSPSHVEHGVTEIEEGDRLVLSFGWVSR